MKIAFRPVTWPDLDLLAGWMMEPHWREWWGEADKELGFIQDMLEGKDRTRPCIFQLNGRDAGYIQVWSAAEEQDRDPADTKPWVALLPKEAVGVDLSIGPAADLGQGIGAAVLKAFVADLRDKGHATILIDPDHRNSRAIKSYRKAGFKEVDELLGKTGDYLIMEHTNQEGVL